MMNAQEIIRYIAESEKKTPVKITIKEKAPIDYGDAQVFGCVDKIVFGDWKKLGPVIEANRDKIADMVILSDDPYTMPSGELKNLQVEQLYLAGKPYESCREPIAKAVLRGLCSGRKV